MKWNSKKIWVPIWVALVITAIVFVGIKRGFVGNSKMSVVPRLNEDIIIDSSKKVYHNGAESKIVKSQKYSSGRGGKVEIVPHPLGARVINILGNAIEICYADGDTSVYILTQERKVNAFGSFLVIQTKEWKKIIPYYMIKEMIIY